jgi:hypothetical protein
MLDINPLLHEIAASLKIKQPASQKKIPSYKKRQGSLMCSRKRTTGRYCQPVQSTSPRPSHFISLIPRYYPSIYAYVFQWHLLLRSSDRNVAHISYFHNVGYVFRLSHYPWFHDEKESLPGREYKSSLASKNAKFKLHYGEQQTRYTFYSGNNDCEVSDCGLRWQAFKSRKVVGDGTLSTMLTIHLTSRIHLRVFCRDTEGRSANAAISLHLVFTFIRRPAHYRCSTDSGLALKAIRFQALDKQFISHARKCFRWFLNLHIMGFQ